MTTTIEDHTLQEGTNAVLADLPEKVQAAQASIRRVLAEGSQDSWTIRELQDRAANGLTSSVMAIAFMRLVQEGTLVVGSDFRVRAA